MKKKRTFGLVDGIEICEKGKNEGFDIVIIIQPILGSSDRIMSEFEKKQFEWKENEQRLPAMEIYANNLELLDNHCTKTADFRNIFDGINEPLYLDAVHIGDKGNEIVAEKIFDVVLPMILKNMSN